MNDDLQSLRDGEARRRIREDLDTTLVVEAAAGTGKTTELVRRILAVLRRGKATLEGIVAVTFTEKAAGELKLRLRSGLEKARGEATQEEAPRLERALAQLEVARIGTIHSLCADLLRERPVEARVDPVFEVVSEDQSRRLFDEAFDRWFQQALAHPGEGVRRILRRKQRGRDRAGARRALRDAAWRLAEQRDFTGTWRRDPFDRSGELEGALDALRGLAAMGAVVVDEESDAISKCLAKAHRFVEELDRREAVRGARDEDGLEAELEEVSRWPEWKKKGWSRGNIAPGIPRADALLRRDEVKAALDGVMERAAADLAAALRPDLLPILDAYAAAKRRAGSLDFVDLLLSARDLLRDDDGVRRDLQRRFTHVFVDEFQDTDPLQAEILTLLAADDPLERDWERATPVAGKLFIVGDPKQSIYRFRRADVVLYERVKRRLEERGASVVYLSTSFRSAPSIQAAVNAAFEPVMRGNEEGSQATYVPLERFRRDLEGQPSVVALGVPRPYGKWGKDPVKWAIDESTPDAVAAFLDWLVRESGWKVTEREGQEPIPVEARHVAILFRKFQSFGEDLTRPFVRALEARRIPHVLVGGRSFHDREEVIAMSSALTAIEWPDDELHVYATLRGPFLAIGDDALLAFKTHVGPLHPLKPIDETKITKLTAPVAEGLVMLRELHRRRNKRPIADTAADLLQRTRAHAGVAIWPTGEQALANVTRVLDLARRFEAGGATSFRAFVEWLEDEAEDGQAGDAPVLEEGTEGVRMMSVHRAKGLEFPVVVLADPTVAHTFQNPTRFVDVEAKLCAEPIAQCVPIELLEHKDAVLKRDHEESIRLAYVATTRARDVLIVPACGDMPTQGWLDVLHPVLYPPSDRERYPEAAPGCPEFGPDTVLERNDKTDRTTDVAVAPGLHAPKAGAHKVVWWDPRALELGVEADGALRQSRILAADDDKKRSDAGIRAHKEWRDAREELLARGKKPSLRVTTATALSETTGALLSGVEDAEVEVLATDLARFGRPHGLRFGTLAHALVASVDLKATPPEVERVARLLRRSVGATDEELDAAVKAVVAALAHPILARAAASDEVRRECPVALVEADGSIVEGVVDLAFRFPERGLDAWTVVDFKTDVELEGRRAQYEAQVRLYVRAIEAATGKRARGVLLSI